MHMKKRVKITFEGKLYEADVSIKDIQQNQVLMEISVDGKTYEVVVSKEKISLAPSSPPSTKTIAIEEKRVEALKPLTFKTIKEKAKPKIGEEFVVESPLPGIVVDIKVSPGKRVNAGDPLLVIDSMKMENIIPSPRSGVILKVEVSVGQSVQTGTPLIIIG
ncbi:biotin/lipoyl-binding protein [Candidatus Bathyarchaeota archaeon]|nr:MAG: biotin/lipoyl-binding protein [Candidatus Bathyarchaeota archaeon]